MEQISRFCTTVKVTARLNGSPVQWIGFSNFAGGVIYNATATTTSLQIVTRNPLDAATRMLADPTGGFITVQVPASGAIQLPSSVFGCAEIGFQTITVSELTFTLTVKG